jgi:hypothetical protein
MYICIYVHNTRNTNKLSLSIYTYKARFYTMGSTCINDLLKLKWKESETAVSLG